MERLGGPSAPEAKAERWWRHRETGSSSSTMTVMDVGGSVTRRTSLGRKATSGLVIATA